MQRSTRIRIAAAIATMAIVVTTAAPAFAAVHLTIDGSTTLFPLAGKWASVYKSSHSGSSITVAGGGSGTGIKDAASGKANIGMSSRAKQTSDASNLVFTPVARDALVIVINPKLWKAYPNYIYRLSAVQVQQIFRGQITNWHQINSHLPSHSIDLVGRTGSSGTYTYFKQLFLSTRTAEGLIPGMHEGSASGPLTSGSFYSQSSRTKTFASNGVVRSTVAGDKYAIGYLAENYVDSSVKVLNLPAPANYYDVNYVSHPTASSLSGHWVVPSLADALNGTYKYVRPLYFVTSFDPSATLPSDAKQYQKDAQTFINWCLSSTGQAYAPGMHFLKLH
jgi:phosphate transport system substrate-binding protein